ncbi:MAG: glutamate-cysteine ligase family protein [Thermodesulfobacteriota bacterium]|nr:glutamate-cysteine ligase family protein [Thermodesulfobacteriota bacterium]
MSTPTDQDNLVEDFTERLLALLGERAATGARTYGFEYEFLAKDALNPELMNEIYAFLSTLGFSAKDDRFYSANGMYVSFEPGGQIEYCSPPLRYGDWAFFEDLLTMIRKTNMAIQKTLGIEYMAFGYVPGRAGAPLCLSSERYQYLHARLPNCGSRGLEMMKGTAAIQLHVVIRNMQEILQLFRKLCELSISRDFKMSPARRNIWDNTDPTRCGMPYSDSRKIDNTHDLLRELVRFTLLAEDIQQNVPFMNLEDISFNRFIYHMTTMFTDVRLNLKGPSLELRTPDSVPPSEFMRKWEIFVSILEDV